VFARLRFNAVMVAAVTTAVLAVCAPSTNASWLWGDAVDATSEHDPALIAALVRLSPTVSPDEARRVTFTAYTTGRQLAAEWRMVRPATTQSFLIHIGARKAGYCFHYANELLLRLDALKLRTLELHWAECDPRDFDEHNVIAVTARGQPFEQGIVLDNWRHSGHLVWSLIKGDAPYRWEENQQETYNRLQHPRHYSRIIPRPEPARSPTQKQKEKKAPVPGVV
jgi:hypothetical protein